MSLSKKALDGNMETLLLSVLSRGPGYGYQMVQEMNALVPGVLKTGEGTIYPVLHRLEERGLVSSAWRVGDLGRQRRYYQISTKGRRALANNRLEWAALTRVMSTVFKLQPV